MNPDLVRVVPMDDGAFWRVNFGAQDGNGNILDHALIAALSHIFTHAGSASGLKAICLDGAGEHFSFGASVQEHLPEHVSRMLADMRGLVTHMVDSNVVIVAAVRGQCLGGGLELASVCHRIVAHEDARLGQPEIALGVLPPIASVVLPHRIGRPRAEDLCLTGRILSAAEAHQIGLVDDVTSGDPADAAIDWCRTNLSHLSASSLRLAVKAIRLPLARAIRDELPAVEAVYQQELMATDDAAEGLRAFLEKRPARWKNS